MSRQWQIIADDPKNFDDGPGATASIGMITLSVDRASVGDSREWIAAFPGAALFTNPVPMSPITNPQNLAEMGDHLGVAVSRLVPGSHLDAIIFSCTSGSVAIGVERIQRALAQVRPGVPVITPIEAAQAGFRALGINRISMLAPYHIDAANLVAGDFEDKGFMLDRCSTFDLDGDLQMNRVSPAALKAAAALALHKDSEGLFISCTGLRTKGIVADLEAQLGVPVITSNQAQSWDALSRSNIADLSRGEGRLFSMRGHE